MLSVAYMISINGEMGRRLMPIQLTMITLAMATMPPIMDKILRNSCNLSHATLMATTGSAYNILATEPVSPNESAVAHAT